MTQAVTATPAARGNRAPVIALIAAEGLSALGTRIAFIALPWLVLVTTHDPIRMGIVSGSASLPYVLNGFIASPLVGRIGARRMSNISDVASAALMAMVALSFNSSIVVLALLVGLEGSFRGVGDRAKNTMLKPLLDATNIDTLRLTSAYTGVAQLAMLTGGSVAGVLIAFFNPWGAIWIDAGSFLVCWAIVSTLVKVPKEPKPEPRSLEGADGLYRSASAKPPTESYVSELKSNFTFVRGNKLIANMVRMLFVTNMFSTVATVTFIPLWISTNENHSPIALGWIGGAFALGGISGNATFTALATRIPRYRAFTAGYLIGGAPRFLVLALSHNLVVVAVVWALSGFALASTNPTIGAVMYRLVPIRMLAGVGALTTGISFSGIALGGLVGGFTVENLGFRNAVLLAGGIYFAASLSPLLGHRTWRVIDVITRRAVASGNRVAVRLVLARHQWTATVRGRDGTSLVEDYAVDAGSAAIALGLMNPPGLESAVDTMLIHEQRQLRDRNDELRRQLQAAEDRLARMARAAGTDPPPPYEVNGNGHHPKIGTIVSLRLDTPT